jgi:hypothetical protein
VDLLGELGQRREVLDGRVGEHDVQTLPALPHPFVQPIHVGRDAHVTTHRGDLIADRGDGLLQLLLAPPRHEHVRALRDEPSRDRQADPGAATGDDGGLAFE